MFFLTLQISMSSLLGSQVKTQPVDYDKALKQVRERLSCKILKKKEGRRKHVLPEYKYMGHLASPEMQLAVRPSQESSKEHAL